MVYAWKSHTKKKIHIDTDIIHKTSVLLELSNGNVKIYDVIFSP